MAAKKRSVSKASARPSTKKSRPAKKPNQSRARKSTAASRAPAKARAKPVSAKSAVKSAKAKPKGSKSISTKNSPASAQSSRTTAKPAVRAKSPQPVKRRTAARQNDTGGPLTSSVGLIHGIPPYKPKAGEHYMSDEQLEHFRNILSAWKRELMEEVDRTVHHMQDEASNFPDPNDRATQESEFGLELRTRDRERKLLKKISSALSRIDDGSYGYCEETGEEIGLKRLEARPVATLCVEAQERRELAERQFRDREDGGM